MGTVQRWYAYIVSAVTLQGLAWALISLARGLVVPDYSAPPTAVAFQVSVLVIGLPLFLVHWLWVQRHAGKDEENRASMVRSLFLIGMMAGFLLPLVNSAFDLVEALLQRILDVQPKSFSYYAYYRPFTPAQTIVASLVSVAVLGAFWLYHRQTRATDERLLDVSEGSATMRQVYTYALTLVGLAMLTTAAVSLFRWLLVQLFPAEISATGGSRVFVAAEVGRLVVGLALWLPFWTSAQRRFAMPFPFERESPVRKIYLYLVVLTVVLIFVTPIALVLADLFQRWLGVPSSGGDLRWPISLVAGAAIVWAYHAAVLRRDAAVAEAEAQASVRRIYLYLIAAIGLAAVLAGLAGSLSTLVRAIGSRSGWILDLREQLSYFVSLLVAGLPLWLINWSRIQRLALADDKQGHNERSALTRRIYLYFFLLAATLAMLGSGIFILSQVVELLLSARTSVGLLTDVSQATAYILIAVGVWLYHGSMVRRESRRLREDTLAGLRPLRVAVIDAGQADLSSHLVTQIKRQVPNAQIQPLTLGPQEGDIALETPEMKSVMALSEADVIVGPWHMAIPGGAISATVAQSVSTSSAQKVLIPVRGEGYSWTGVESWKAEEIVKETAAAVRQLAAGEVVRSRRLGTVKIVLIVAGVLVLLCLVGPALLYFFSF